MSLAVFPSYMLSRQSINVAVTSATIPKPLRVLITGGSRGIGAAIAVRYAMKGASVAILGRSMNKPWHPSLDGTLPEVARVVERCGGTALSIECDIRDVSATKSAIQDAIHYLNGLDILIHNASALDVSYHPSVEKMSTVMDVNARGTLAVGLECEKALQESEGCMVTMSPPIDLNRRDWIGNHPHYTISKYAMTMAALGFAQRGIRSNTLWPRHLIATAATKSLETNVPGAYTKGRPPHHFAEVVCALTMDTETTGTMLYDDDVIAMPPTDAPLDLYVS